MLDVLKQAIFTGIGLATVTRDRIDSLVDEVAKKVDLSEQQVAEFKSEVAQRSDQAREELEKQIDQQIDHAFIQAGLAKAEVKRAAGQTGEMLEQMIDSRIDAMLKRAGVAHAQDIEPLVQRINALEEAAKKSD